MENEENKTEVLDVTLVDPYEHVDVISDTFYEGKEKATVSDIEYMCNFIANNIGCEYCPLKVSNKICPFALLLKKYGTYTEINKEILKWLSENPPTSYLMDIREKMPNVVIDSNYNIPNFCVKDIYGNDCCECCKSDNVFDKADMYCRKCWRQPM